MSDAPEKRNSSRGRPRAAAPERRGQGIHVRVRTDELHRIEQLAAQACHRSISDYIREVALTGKVVIKRFRRVEPIVLHDLSRIGNNLNQIARICNQTGDIQRHPACRAGHAQ